MLADPLTLRNNAAAAVFDLASTLGSKTIRLQVSGMQTLQTSGSLTVSHDQNVKTKRRRSVLRFDATHVDATTGLQTESTAVYLVIDRAMPSVTDPSGVTLKAMVAELLSFFATDPTAVSPGSIPYAISTTLGVKFLAGEP